ncbi:MAG: glycine betaine ABC transporter substrate-binding protein [Pseudomonadota bacterium]
MRSSNLIAMCSAVAISISSAAASAADVVIGVPNWPSVQATAHVLKVALESNLGIEVELKEGSNEAVFDAMHAGTMHVHPEAWLPNLNHLRRKYVISTKTIKMHPSGATGTQGMCVTKGTAERTGINSIKDLRNPEMAKKFDSDGDSKGEVWIGAKGWGSTPIEQIRARSYGYDKTMNLRIMEENVALAEVDKAVKQQKDIVFFCYTPHYMFAANEIVVLDEPSYDATKWIIVPPSDTPGWLQKSSAAVAWDTAHLHISYATALEDSQPKAAAALSRVSFSTDTLTAMTYSLVVEKLDPALFAAKWVEQNQAIVSKWFQ